MDEPPSESSPRFATRRRRRRRRRRPPALRFNPVADRLQKRFALPNRFPFQFDGIAFVSPLTRSVDKRRSNKAKRIQEANQLYRTLRDK